MTQSRRRQVGSWLLIAAVVVLCWIHEAFFPGFALVIAGLRPDLLSKDTADVIESKYRPLAMFGGLYAAVIGVGLFVCTLLLQQPPDFWIGLRFLYLVFWPFVLILALNEYRLFTEAPNDSQPTCEGARGP